jgi:LmbE family N-acetylglucosaminyl deacetylase
MKSNSTENKRVLAVMPHPDDVEILCGGTLLRLVECGFGVHIAHMTPGDKGSAQEPSEVIAAIRREEAQRGAACLRAESCRCLEFEDLSICFDNPSRRRVVELIREVDPLLVITTPPHDYMFDHEMTSWLVRDACFSSSVPNYSTESGTKPGSGVPYLYYSDALAGHDIFGRSSPASCIVDITNQIDQKTVALSQHESQRAWLQKQHGTDDYLKSMQEWGARRGEEIGVAFGEAFCQHVGHPHPQDDLLAKLLGYHFLDGQDMQNTQ